MERPLVALALMRRRSRSRVSASLLAGLNCWQLVLLASPPEPASQSSGPSSNLATRSRGAPSCDGLSSPRR